MSMMRNNSEYGAGTSGRIKFFAFILLTILAVTVAVKYLKVASTGENVRGNDSQVAAQAVAISPITLDGLPEYEQAVISATQKALPAVVSILAYGTRDVVYHFRNPLMEMLYGGRVGGQQSISAMGSGVLIDPGGTIITNDHVIGLRRDARVKLQVTLPDGRVFDASLIKSFPSQDIAILSIEGENLPYIEFGSSADVIQGQTAIAIGNPFGNMLTEGLSGSEPTVTRGVISALKRSMTYNNEGIIRYYRNMLQTDASINEGNSGGALIDIEGRLIGINTAIYTAGGAGSIGIGFAIPSDRVKLILESMEKYGDIGIPYVGLGVEEMSKSMRDAVNLKTRDGIIVASVKPESPADESGFKRGDVITVINGLHVTTVEDAQSMFRGAVPGEVYVLTVLRDGEFREIELKLGAQKK